MENKANDATVDIDIENVPLEKYLIFTIQGKCCSLPSKIIGEVAALEKVFPLPVVPDYVKGIINRYSIPYALIDLAVLIFNTSSESQKLVVLKEELDRIAFLIDDVTDIADIPPGALMMIEQEDANTAEIINAYFEWKGSHVFCLDVNEIIKRIGRDFSKDN